jgi:hypothetical protein
MLASEKSKTPVPSMPAAIESSAIENRPGSTPQEEALRVWESLIVPTPSELAAAERRAKDARAVRTPQEEARRAQVVASFEGGKVTVGDLEDEISRQPPVAQHRFTSRDHKRSLLNKIIRTELLARAGERRGYAGDPEVIQAVKLAAVQSMIRERVDDATALNSIPSEEVINYYNEHISEFIRPENRGANHVLVATMEPTVRKRLWRNKRDQAVKALVKDIRANNAVDSHPDLMDAIQLESDAPSEASTPGSR